MRACHSADRTGHMILQTLYQQCIKQGVTFFDEFHMLDLIMVDGECRGIVAIEIATGQLHVFHAKSVLLATGGFGRMFKVSSNAYALTGDGPAIAYRHGLPLEDMEFYQFHPTGIYRLGILLSEACRGDGGDHVQRQGRAVHGAVRPQPQGPGQPRRLLAVDLPGGPRRPGGRRQGLRLPRHPRRDDQQVQDQPAPGSDVDSAWVEKRLPDIIEFARTYLGVDPIKEPMPIQPTAHYAMGGCRPTSTAGCSATPRARSSPACTRPARAPASASTAPTGWGPTAWSTWSSTAGASGRAMAEYAREPRVRSTCPPHPEAPAKAEIDALLSRPRTEPWVKIRDEMQVTMMDDCGVYRTAETLTRARDDIAGLKAPLPEPRRPGQGDRSSTRSLLEILELGCLLDLAEATVAAALARTREPRRPLPRGLPRPRRRRLLQAQPRLLRPARTRPASTTRTSTSSWSRRTASTVPKYPLEIRKY